MSKIHSISIKNFRGFKEFSHVFDKSNLICLIGRGDSGKSTILEAISYVLSPSWSLTFYDSDFNNCIFESPIEIVASLIDLPEKLINENKYGLYIRGLDNNTNIIHDEVEDSHKKLLTIKLEVKKDLEPKWYVINKRQEPISISAYDRAKLNVFMISDYVDRHFSWSKGNPLYKLLKQEDLDDDGNIIIDALREAKEKIDEYPFDKFQDVIDKIKINATELGLDISKTSTSIDFKDISIKDGRVCLHEEMIPFRLKGKGSKRLISIAIQTALAENGGIILIDEIEQGLEPDRAQHLASTLKAINKGQIFITTHSRDILVELDASDLFLIKRNAEGLITFDNSLQGCLRKNPEAFFANKIIVCEGPTEIGICRATNNYRIKNGKENASVKGVRFADGVGSNLLDYCDGFNKSKFPVCLFCDSDNNNINEKKEALKSEGIKIADWEDGECLEVAVAKYLPFEAIKGMLNLAFEIRKEDTGGENERIKKSICDSIKSRYGNEFPDSLTLSNLTPELRKAIGETAHDNKWFKSISNGEVLGDLIFKYYDSLGNNKLKQQLDELSNWIDE